MDYPKWLQSSENSANLSLTVKALVTFALLTFGGQEASNAFADQAANAIVIVIVAAGQLVSAVGIIWGLIRKWRNAK